MQRRWPELLHKMNAYWRAANYLSVGQMVRNWKWKYPSCKNADPRSFEMKAGNS